MSNFVFNILDLIEAGLNY